MSHGPSARQAGLLCSTGWRALSFNSISGSTNRGVRPCRAGIRTRRCLAGLGLLGAVFLAGCASSPPSNPDDICDIFTEKKDWYAKARKASSRWNSPIPVLMAITFQESSFRARAKPPRRKLLGVIPWRRPDAFGYAQATDAAWSDYVRATGRRRADRDDFGDAMDFVGWYNRESNKRNGIDNNDAYRLYLAYHEGHGGYARGSYRAKSQLQHAARRVAERARTYDGQLQGCQRRLNRGRRWWSPI